MTIHELANNPTLSDQVRLIENIVYGAMDGEALHMSILAPWTQRFPKQYQTEPRPLIVFVQEARGERQKWEKKFHNWFNLFGPVIL